MGRCQFYVFVDIFIQRYMTLKEFLSSGDKFASGVGCRIEAIGEGWARASMTVGERHLNAGGVCQGGALFTLADFALAAAMNSGGSLTLGIQNNIMYVKSALLGDVLTAEARLLADHKKLPCVDVRITNQVGDLLCVVSGMAYRKREALPIDGLE